MFIMAQTIDWPVMTYSAMNSRGPHETPGYKEQPWLALFFIIFIIFGSFFMMNLFVGVVLSAYNKEMERIGSNFLLTSE